MFNIEQDNKEFTQVNMQNSSPSGICPPSHPQHQVHQSPLQAQFYQQQNEYSTQYAHTHSLATGHQYQQQTDFPNGIGTPFNYNLSNVPPAFYSSNDLVTPPIQSQQDHQPLQMNTNIQLTSPPQQQQKRQYDHGLKIGNSTRLSEEDDELSTADQFKMMTSKERRQLRNKLSARNFRNRRKEYVTSLEKEVNTFKTENSQLQLEIKWMRTIMTKLQNENDDLRVKLALCKGGITTKQQSTLSDRRSSQGLQHQISPPTAMATTAPVPPQPQSPALPLQSDHPPPVQPTSTTTVTKGSQNPLIFTGAVTQNGNSLFKIPDLPGSSPHRQPFSQQATQQQPITSSSLSSSLPPPSNSLNSTQQQHLPICPREIKEKLDFSTSVTTSPSPPGTNLESIRAAHSGSLSFCPADCPSSPTDFISSTNTWNMTIPNHAIPLTYPLDTTNTTTFLQEQQQLLVPPLFENTSSFYSMESHQNPISTNQQQHLTTTETHHQSCHVNQQQRHQQTLSNRLQPLHQPLERATIIDNNSNSNNSNVSNVVFPDFDFVTALDKQQQQQQATDGNILWRYPLLVPALVSIIIDHTMNMSTDELLSHSRLLLASTSPAAAAAAARRIPSTCIKNPGGGDKRKPYLGSGNNMAPGLRYPVQHNSNFSSSLANTYPLSKKQLEALWERLLSQMVITASQEQTTLTTTASVAAAAPSMVKATHEDQPQMLWYEAPVTGFKSICPLYWIQRQLCRFVITYVIAKYPRLEIPCKTYLPICEQFRRRVVNTTHSLL